MNEAGLHDGTLQLVCARAAMNKTLLSLGILVSAVGIVWWFAAGANTGWTKTSVQRLERDPVTEIETPVWDKRFVPGIELLAATGAVSIALIAAARLLRRKTASQT